MFIEKVTSNGVRFVAEKIEGVRSTAVGIWVRAGSVTETEETSGISHFIEHMLFKGTERRTYLDIAAEMDRVGGQLNAFTAKEMTCYYARVIDEQQLTAIDLLSDMFVNSQFADGEMAKEKNVICEEISMSHDDCEDVAHEKLSEMHFKGSQLERPILGTEENVQGFTAEDIRKYMRERYAAEDVVVVAVGNVDVEGMIAKIEDELGCLPKKGIARAALSEYTMGGEFTLVRKDVEQVHVGLGFPGYVFEDPDKYAFSVVSSILGGGMSSRLFQKIREERGMAYSVYCYPSVYREAGMLSLYAGTSPKNAVEAEKLMIEEVERMLHEGITETELTDTKEQLRGNFILAQENMSAKMNTLGKNLLLTGKIMTETDVLDRLKNVTMDDIHEVIERVFVMDKMSRVRVGAEVQA